MKVYIKRIIGAMLIFALVTTMIPITTSYAATRKIVLYTGENMITSVPGILVSVSSSKKECVALKKEKKSQNSFMIIPKKAGSALVTIKYKNFYYKTVVKKIKVTVKKLDMSVKLIHTNGTFYNLYYMITNKTKQTFESAKIAYIFKNSEGKVLCKGEANLEVMQAGKTMYEFVFCDCDQKEVDIDKSSVKISSVFHNPNTKYVDTTDYTDLDIREVSGVDQYNFGWKGLNLQYKNRYNKNIDGDIYVLLYDADNNLLYMQPYFLNDLKSKKTGKETFRVEEGTVDYERYDHCEVCINTYSIE